MRTVSACIIDIILFILDNLLLVIKTIFKIFLLAVTIVIDTLWYHIMTESSETKKKRRRSNAKSANQAIFDRSLINANWQKMLSSNMIEKRTTEKVVEQPEHYTGIFRRDRKKSNPNLNNNNNVISVQNTLNGLNINGEISKTNEKRNTLTKFIAMDCEMVGIGFDGKDHMLARISLVNKFGECIYDKYVKAREDVIDYRTSVSGIRREDMLNGVDFTVVQKEVSEILKGRILVGHSLKNDLSVLFLSHPKKCIRDTSKYKPFKKITKGSTPSLKRLSKEILGIDIQSGEHSSVEDAKAAMQLYCTVAKKWEDSLSGTRGYVKRKALNSSPSK